MIYGQIHIEEVVKPLKALTEEVRMLGEYMRQGTLPEIKGPLAKGPPPIQNEAGNSDSLLSATKYVRLLIARRKERERLFGSDIFGEPGWDMMLDLYLARKENRQIYVSSLCLASRSPSTTALRHIANLVAEGMLLRRADAHDRRRVWIELAPHVVTQMDALISGWIEQEDQSRRPGQAFQRF